MYKIDTEEVLLHGGDYNPDQWLDHPEILQRDIAYMKEAHINTVTVGVFSWATMEPVEGEYNFEWLDWVFDQMEAMNGYVILATPSGGRPQWLSEKYPEVNRVDQYGRRHQHGFRHNHCYSSPVYRYKVTEMNTLLAKRYGKRPALLMWHVSNEFSGECYCDLCQASWRRWLQHKYQTLDRLNDAWSLSVWSGLYSSWSQVVAPSPLGETKVHGMDLDWKRFVTARTIDFFDHEIVPLKQITPDIPVTTNFMAEGQDQHQFVPLIGLNYQEFAKHVDIVSWDSYPDWHNRYESVAQTAMKTAYIHDQYRSLKKRPFLVMESTPSFFNWGQYNKAKQPGMHILSSLQQIAHGSDSSLYFQIRQARGHSEKFHGAVIGHDDSNQSRVFKEVSAYGQMLERIAAVKGGTTEAKVALVYDWESNWALNRGGGYGRPTRSGIQTLQKHYEVFWQQDIACDIVASDADLSQYQLVVAPMLYMMTPEVMAHLQRYVQAGGTLISSYFTAWVDTYDRANIGGFPEPLRDLFGIETKELDTLLPGEHYHVTVGNNTYQTSDYDEIIHTKTAEILGCYQDNFYAGTAAVTRNQFGQGTAYYLAARLDIDFLQHFYQLIIDRLQLKNTFIEVANPLVSCQTRIKAGIAYHFLMNFSESEQSVVIRGEAQNLENQEICQGMIVLPKYGVLVLKSLSS